LPPPSHGCGDKRFRNTAGDGRQTLHLGGRDAVEGVQNTTTVPNSPTNGAVEPMVARLPNPLFQLGVDNGFRAFQGALRGFNDFAWNVRAGLVRTKTPSGRLEQLWPNGSCYWRSATLIASSRFPCFKAPATAGANDRDWLRAALKARHAVNHYADRPSGHDKQDADHNLGPAFPST